MHANRPHAFLHALYDLMIGFGGCFKTRNVLIIQLRSNIVLKLLCTGKYSRSQMQPILDTRWWMFLAKTKKNGITRSPSLYGNILILTCVCVIWKPRRLTGTRRDACKDEDNSPCCLVPPDKATLNKTGLGSCVFRFSYKPVAKL